MATYLENLTTTRDQIAANLVEITADPKPNYSIDGQTVSWADLFRTYTEQLAALNKTLAAADPFELESIGF
jgi:hypothetical protein